MTIRICRLHWGEALPNRDEAERAGIRHWLLPAQFRTTGSLELGIAPAALLQQLPGHGFCIAWQLPQPLTPRQEQQAGLLLRPWLLHPQALRIQGRPALWLHDPQQLSHPRFARQRLQQAVDAELLLLAAGPPEPAGFEAMYERSDWIPCQELDGQVRNYESYLFHAHHRPVGEAALVVPCATAAPAGPTAHTTAVNYREWLALGCAWSELRHPQPSERLLLIESWSGHQAWCPDAPTETDPAAEHSASHTASTEQRWGQMQADHPALLIHGYHLDLLEQRLQPLAAAGATQPPLDLYVSTPHQQLQAAAALLQQQGWARVCLVGCDNRGRDQAPFLLELLPRAVAAGHPWLVKLHTKRSLQTPGGERWGAQLWQQLASGEGLQRIEQLLQHNPQLQLIAPSGSLLPSSVCLARNTGHLQTLLSRCGITPRWLLSQAFAAGSIWAARTTALRPLLELGLSWEHFEAESGQVDGCLAHALERLIPALVVHHLGRALALDNSEPMALPGYGHPWAAPGIG